MSTAPTKDFPRSFRFTERHTTYTVADTWYPSWGADGALYSPYTDGAAGGISVMSLAPLAATGAAVIRGDDPLALEIKALPPHARPCSRFDGNYPAGSLVHDGRWYYGTYYLRNRLAPDGGYTIYEMGPFAGFRVSTDGGQTWVENDLDDRTPLFPESGRPDADVPVRFGAPKFVDFGRNMEHSPDGKAYLVGHGSSRSNGVANWCSGDEVVLARVTPSPAKINDLASYEFFSGTENGEALWSADFLDLAPIFAAPGAAGLPAMTWNPGLRRFLLCLCGGPAHGGDGAYDTHILVGENVWGPWEPLVSLPSFGSQGYFVNIPSKFLSGEGTTGWLWWSANWYSKLMPTPEVFERPLGSRYGLCMREFVLEQ